MKANLFTIEEKTILITGSTGGLGLAMARGLAEQGARVVLNGRNRDKMEKAVAALRNDGLDARGVSFDVGDSPAIAGAVERIESQIGPIEVLFNNAGITRRDSLEKLDESEWREVVETNLTSPYLVAKAVVPAMIRRGRGKIINICSLMSRLGRPTTGAYAASKGGLLMLTRGMTADWAKWNIQINAIGPGYFKTEMTRPLSGNPEFTEWLSARTPAGRWGEPSELVGTAVFLAAPASDFVNGQIIYVDGGIQAVL